MEEPQTWPDHWFRDSAMIVGGLSLWLYLIATFFVSGYLDALSAEAEWFSPSLFQLFAFVTPGFLYVSFLVALLTSVVIGRSRPGWGWWGRYSALVVLAFMPAILLLVLGRAVGLIHVASFSPLLVVPLFIRAWSGKPVESMERDAEQSIPAEDLERVLEQQKAELATLKTDWLYRRRTPVIVFILASILLVAARSAGHTYGTFAIVRALYNFQHTALLFSDGERHITLERAGSLFSVVCTMTGLPPVILIQGERMGGEIIAPSPARPTTQTANGR